MAKKQVNEVGTAIILGDWNYAYNSEQDEWVKTNGENRLCEVLPVREVHSDRIVTDKYVLPVSDAEIYNSPKGLAYVYSASLPYIQETAHLLDVENNRVVGQAYLYQGKNIPNGKPNGLTWVLILGLIIICIVGIVK